MRKDAYPKGKVELVFETSKLDVDGNPTAVTAHKVPAEMADEIASYFNIMGTGEIMINEATYNKKLRQLKAVDPEIKDRLGWVNHKLGPNLGKSGIWGCKLINQYSLEKDNSQRGLFYDEDLGTPEADITELEPVRQERKEDLDSFVEIVETWNTDDGKFRPNAKRILVATEKGTGEFIASREMPENFSGQARDALEREAEAILAARQRAA